MRVRGLAFVGLVVGAFLASPSSSIVSATAVQTHSNTKSIEKFFSSDGPESLHEAKNQGTLDEPKAWPEANAWLHASLTETEREFLSLAVTGTVNPAASTTGGLTGAQLVDTSATINVQLRFFRNPLPANFATQLQTDLVNSISGASTSSVTVPTFSQQNIGNGVYQVASFTFKNNGQTPAGAFYVTLTSAFAQASSPLRVSTSFQDIDLSFFPTAQFVAGGSTAAPSTAAPSTQASSSAAPSTAAPSTATPSTSSQTTVKPSTATPTTVSPSTAASGGNSNYCSTHPTACLNGGTCVNDPTTSPYYTCTCPSGYIGHECQFSLFNNSKRNKVQGVLPKGRSVTRPNAVRTSVKIAQ